MEKTKQTLITVLVVVAIPVIFLVVKMKQRSDILHKTAEEINQLCNAHSSCPKTLPGWEVDSYQKERLRKGLMSYYPNHNDSNYQEFSLHMNMMTDTTGFATGGVGREVHSKISNR